jgi:hypothetical protein
MIKEIEINGFTIKGNEDPVYPGVYVIYNGSRIADIEHVNDTHISMRIIDNQKGKQHTVYWNKNYK